MILKGTFKVVAIKKKTKAVLFQDLKVGDELTVTYPLSGGFGYAPTVEVRLGNWEHWNDITQFNKNIRNFEVEQLS